MWHGKKLSNTVTCSGGRKQDASPVSSVIQLRRWPAGRGKALPGSFQLPTVKRGQRLT